MTNNTPNKSETTPQPQIVTNQQENNTKKTEASVSENSPNKKQAPGILSIFQSVLAAMFGVQSEEKRQQDFENGSIGNYIFVGVVMVIIFIITLVMIVDSILENAG